MSETLFSETYHQARETFLEAVAEFESQVGWSAERHRRVVDEGEDLTIDVVEWIPEQRERLYLVVSGLHGLEGYTGSAIMRGALGWLLRRIDRARCGLVLVHGVNPWGFHHFRRVNANNVDLNRNFEVEGERLYGSESGGYESLEHILNPHQGLSGGVMERGGFFIQTLTALLMRGMGPLRQATLAGQYSRPKGLFYGGDAPQEETLFYQEHFRRLCPQYPEILLNDLHTGYGDRGKAYPLFPQADSKEIAALANQGVKDEGGADQTYTARGELVRYSYETAKKLNPDVVFNGLVVEVGTHGLSAVQQMRDLEIVVRENQAHHQGASSDAAAALARDRFKDFFYPASPEWRRQIYQLVTGQMEDMLARRGFLLS